MALLTEPIVGPINIPEILTQTQEEGQVIVHVHMILMPGSQIRIWPSTYLHCQGGEPKKPLIHAENISLAPQWTQIDCFVDYRFTLIFNGLPKGCTSFDLIEEIEETGAFQVFGIERNRTDVYRIRL